MKLVLSLVVCLLFTVVLNAKEDKEEKECNHVCSNSEECNGGRCCRDLDGAIYNGESPDGSCYQGKAAEGELCDKTHCHCDQGYECVEDEFGDNRCSAKDEGDD